MVLKGKKQAMELIQCCMVAQESAMRFKLVTRVYDFGAGVFGFLFTEVSDIKADLVCVFGPDGKLMALNLFG